MGKHTRLGELYVYRDEDGNAAAINRWAQGPNGGLSADSLARVHLPNGRVSRSELNQYATLFSAAPELLSALIAAEGLFSHTFAEGGTVHKQMCAAIAKARGVA